MAIESESFHFQFPNKLTTETTTNSTINRWVLLWIENSLHIRSINILYSSMIPLGIKRTFRFMHIENYYSLYVQCVDFECVNKIKSEMKETRGDEMKTVKSSCIACISIHFNSIFHGSVGLTIHICLSVSVILALCRFRFSFFLSLNAGDSLCVWKH